MSDHENPDRLNELAEQQAEYAERRAQLASMPDHEPTSWEWLRLRRKYIRTPRGWRGLAVRLGWWFEALGGSRW